MKLFVEGGGTSNQLRTACREGFSKFITAAGVSKRPRIVACGSREDAFDSFCTEIGCGNPAFLLVDSETAVAATAQAGTEPENWQPWNHLRLRVGDEWEKPASATHKQCHLMVECMESWFMADRATLIGFFGQGFQESQLPPSSRPIECLSKATVYDGLKRATRPSRKGEYGKGDHSFKLLAEISPHLVMAASPWAKRFIDELKQAMGC